MEDLGLPECFHGFEPECEPRMKGGHKGDVRMVIDRPQAACHRPDAARKRQRQRFAPTQNDVSRALRIELAAIDLWAMACQVDEAVAGRWARLS